MDIPFGRNATGVGSSIIVTAGTTRTTPFGWESTAGTAWTGLMTTMTVGTVGTIPTLATIGFGAGSYAVAGSILWLALPRIMPSWAFLLISCTLCLRPSHGTRAAHTNQIMTPERLIWQPAQPAPHRVRAHDLHLMGQECRGGST